MNEIFQILEKVGNTTKRTEKIALIKSIKNNKIARWYLYNTFNPYKNFFITAPPIKNTFSEETDFEYVNTILEWLSGRKITGNEAKDVTKDMLRNYVSREDLIWIQKLINKDLKIGIGATTVNKVFGKDFIPTFKCALCEAYKDNIDNLSFPYYSSLKIDGQRCLILKDVNEEIAVFSRSGKTIYNVDHIIKEIEELPVNDIVLDGELVADNWNNTISIAHTQEKHSNAKSLSFKIFDIIPYDDWKEQKGKMIFSERIKLIDSKDIDKCNYIKLLKHKIVNSREELKKDLKEVLGQGYEGLVIKKDTAYPFKRSTEWLKLKSYESIDLEIVRLEAGKPDGKYANTMGKVVVDYNGVEVGAGFKGTNKYRDKLWSIKDDIVGQIAEIQHLGETKDGSLKNAYFIRLRKDKS